MIDTCLRIIEASDVVPPLALLMMLLFIGQKTTANHPVCAVVGYRSALAAFAVYASWRIFAAERIDACSLITITFRSLLAAGFVAATVWIILPLAAYLHALALAYIVLPVKRALNRLMARKQAGTAKRQFQMEQEHRRRQDELSAPERERAKREEQARIQAEQTAKEDQQRQRDELRLDVQLFYDRYRTALGDAFPPAQFQHYVDRYLRDDVSPAVLKEHCDRLKETIRDFSPVAQSLNHPKFQSMHEALAYFRQQRESLKELGLDPDTLDTLLISIDTAQDRALQELLR